MIIPDDHQENVIDQEQNDHKKEILFLKSNENEPACNQNQPFSITRGDYKKEQEE